jgi:hypothetical protein
MGAVKEMAWEFCEIVYPKDYKKQNKLFKSMLNLSNKTINPVTIEKIKEFYEETGKFPNIDISEIFKMVNANEF